MIGAGRGAGSARRARVRRRDGAQPSRATALTATTAAPPGATTRRRRPQAPASPVAPHADGPRPRQLSSTAAAAADRSPLTRPSCSGPATAGPKVRDLQARLRQIALVLRRTSPTATARPTTTAVKGFQAKREIPVTGYVDQRTLDRLHAMTRTPTDDELANALPGSTSTPRAAGRPVPDRARAVHRQDQPHPALGGRRQGPPDDGGAVRGVVLARPARALFHVGWKSRDHVSKLYDSAMPFAMFFSGGQAVHYSSDFAARGYSGASHGCVNVRDYAGHPVALRPGGRRRQGRRLLVLSLPSSRSTLGSA